MNSVSVIKIITFQCVFYRGWLKCIQEILQNVFSCVISNPYGSEYWIIFADANKSRSKQILFCWRMRILWTVLESNDGVLKYKRSKESDTYNQKDTVEASVYIIEEREHLREFNFCMTDWSQKKQRKISSKARQRKMIKSEKLLRPKKLSPTFKIMTAYKSVNNPFLDHFFKFMPWREDKFVLT